MTYANDPRKEAATRALALIDAGFDIPTVEERRLEAKLLLEVACHAPDWARPALDDLLGYRDSMKNEHAASDSHGATWSDGADAYIATGGIAIRNDQDEEA